MVSGHLEAGPSKKRWKRIVSMIFVNLFLFCVGIVLLELVFGAWISPDNLNRLNLIEGRIIRYDVSGLYDAPSPVIQYSRDRYGLRGSHGTPEKITLLTVGGSTTDQRYIPDGSTWQDVLQERFAISGIPMVVANAGVDGQSTWGHIKNFDWWFPRVPNLRPRYILFYLGINDFYKEGDSPKGIFPSLSEKSALWCLARTLIGSYRASVILKIGHRRIDFERESWTDRPIQKEYEFMRPRLNAYEKRLQTLLQRTKEFGSMPICVSQPSRHYKFMGSGPMGRASLERYADRQINGLDHYLMMRELDRVTESVCRASEVAYIDLGAQTEWDDLDFYDFTHMTPRGTKKLGLRLFDRLVRVVDPSRNEVRKEQ